MENFTQIAGVGPKTAEKLNRLKIFSKKDLLYHFPTRYVDFSHSIKISETVENENVTITGKIISFNNIFTRMGKNLQRATVQDDTGQINLVWFNQPYLSKAIVPNTILSFAGTVTLFQNKKTIIAPEYGHYNTGKIIAVYPETQGLSSKWFRKTIQSNIFSLVSDVPETLPAFILKKYQLMDLKNALIQIHTPSNASILTKARTRLALDEILSIQAQSYVNKKEWLVKKPAFVLTTNPTTDNKINKLIESLLFQLTNSQLNVWEEIKDDLLSKTKIMKRLLQGDVGSGKTIIAILASYLTYLNGHLSLIVAPTEILAQQHYQTFSKILKKFRVPIFLLTGSKKINFDNIPKKAIIISTHAALYRKNEFENQVALFIVDEQHKFGVKQRSFLSTGINLPHNLTMTATPIPRTISLTLLGNLDISTIDTPPQSRLIIKTFLVPNHKKTDCYNWIKQDIKANKSQAFIVCPFIDISETLTSVKSAIKEYEFLSKNIFSDLKIALIHGKTKNKDREKIIRLFQKNKINILVTTPIIEVGVDIPNASIIVIQSADRFGLAQLHQLRGRVGRGLAQSYCYLFTESNNEKAIQRLEFLQQHKNGLKIAEYDLQTRGPGEIYSTIQHGFPSLKLADISDIKLINFSKQVLKDIISENISLDNILKQKAEQNLNIQN